ncbi:hypothetical protein pb186bvf_016566 [Paramecium bursaria]
MTISPEWDSNCSKLNLKFFGIHNIFPFKNLLSSSAFVQNI